MGTLINEINSSKIYINRLVYAKILVLVDKKTYVVSILFSFNNFYFYSLSVLKVS